MESELSKRDGMREIWAKTSSPMSETVLRSNLGDTIDCLTRFLVERGQDIAG